MGEPPFVEVRASPTPPDSSVQPSKPRGWRDIVRPDALARETAGGRLEVFLVPTAEGEGYELRLDGRVVIKSSYELMNAGKRSGLEPWIAGSVGAIAPFDEVLLVGWAAHGNACSGYGMTFVGIHLDGRFSVADIPYCGGPEPLVHVAATRVTVVIPEHPPNRGQGRVPRKTYLYTAGNVVRIR